MRVTGPTAVVVPHWPMGTLNVAVLYEGGERNGECKCGVSLCLFKEGLAARDIFKDTLFESGAHVFAVRYSTGKAWRRIQALSH